MIRFADTRDLIARAGDAPRFRADSVPYALIAEILRAAAGPAPARFDRPPWRFVVVVEKEREQLISRVAEALARHWGLGSLGPRGLASDAVMNAPVLVVIFSAVPSSEGLEAFGMVAGVAQNAILLGHAAGLAMHRIYSANVVPDAVLDFVAERLGPDLRSSELVAMLALGFPAAEAAGENVADAETKSEQAACPVISQNEPHWLGRVDQRTEVSFPPAVEAAKPALVLRASRGERVLVADAFPFNRVELATQLGAADYHVESFATGAALLQRSALHPPDLYLISESLPDMSGFELVRRILGSGGLRAPIVVTTARRDSAFRIAGLSAGVDYYLRKPINPIELYTATRILLERHRLVEEMQRKNDELGQLLGELRTAQASLVQQGKMAALGQLVAGVAHEINTPLGAVVSNNDLFVRAFERLRVELCGQSLTLSAPIARDLAAIEKLLSVTREACGRITGIVRTLRTFARVDGADLQSIDLNELLDSTLVLIAHLARPNTSITRHYGELPRIECHRNQINQVLMNLLANACQAIEDAGTVTITTSLEGEWVKIAVSDTGRGIVVEDKARIFDPGFTTKSTGVGLGLMISYQIIEAHGGALAVESEFGVGTTFTVRLPVAQPRRLGG